jgi:hypothetical protein
MTAPARSRTAAEYVPENAMDEPDEIARFYDRCSDLMRELLDGLAQAPDRPRPFPEIEDAIGWPRRRIASRPSAKASSSAALSGRTVAVDHLDCRYSHQPCPSFAACAAAPLRPVAT